MTTENEKCVSTLNETKKFQLRIDIEEMEKEFGHNAPNTMLAYELDLMLTDKFETEDEFYDWVRAEFKDVGDVYFRIDEVGTPKLKRFTLYLESHCDIPEEVTVDVPYYFQAVEKCWADIGMEYGVDDEDIIICGHKVEEVS